MPFDFGGLFELAKHTLSRELIEDYDLFQRSVPHHDLMQRELARVVERYAASAAREVVVLEAGTGTGITTELLLRAHPSVRVLSVDVEAPMISRASGRLHSFGERVQFVVGDILEVLKQTPNESVDIFASAYTLHHMEGSEWPELAKAVARTLKPGGLYINADKIARTDATRHANDLVEQLAAFRVFDEMGRPDLRREWERHYLADDKTKVDEAQQLGALAEAGLQGTVAWRKRMEAIITAEK